MQGEYTLVSPALVAIEGGAEPGSVQRKIVVRDIKKSFATPDGVLDVIANISFDVADGRILAIVGPSGCGKSTLMNIIVGFDRPDRGTVLVDGLDRAAPNPKGILISQQGSVFPWLTVQENLTFGLTRGTSKERLEIASHYIAMVGLQGFERRYPHELSGGMLKRVEIARAMAMQPEVLFMDEPFSALDALMSLRMRHELLRILERQRLAVILITHDVEEALQLADQVLVLSNRPTTVKARFDVPYEHPRRVTGQEIQELKESILSILGV